jgi:hypothetical protein
LKFSVGMAMVIGYAILGAVPLLSLLGNPVAMLCVASLWLIGVIALVTNKRFNDWGDRNFRR